MVCHSLEQKIREQPANSLFLSGSAGHCGLRPAGACFSRSQAEPQSTGVGVTVRGSQRASRNATQTTSRDRLTEATKSYCADIKQLQEEGRSYLTKRPVALRCINRGFNMKIAGWGRRH